MGGGERLEPIPGYLAEEEYFLNLGELREENLLME
jgi:hypothetical protein